jgi:hypothetical protein
MGYTIAAYPLTLLNASIKVMQTALARLKDGSPCDDLLLPFTEVRLASQSHAPIVGCMAVCII